MRSMTGLCTAAVLAAGLLTTSVVLAQGPAPSAPPTTKPAPTTPAPSTSPANIPEKKLDQAAAAAKNVSQIGDRYKAKVAQAPAADKERLVGEANDAMTKAINDQGLSLDEYMSILRVAQTDPGVRSKLLQRMQ